MSMTGSLASRNSQHLRGVSGTGTMSALQGREDGDESVW